MTIQITGKNLDAGNAFQTYAGDKIRGVLQKYLGREPDGHIRLERERGLFKTTCSVRLTSGLLLEAHGEGGDAYASVDAATHRLETRVRRHKGRIKKHSSAAATARRKADVEASDHVVGLADDDQPEQEDGNPLIIAEGQRNIGHMTVSEAVMHLDLSEASFMIFRNSGHGGLNVVYRRGDGNIGWIDAELPISSKPNGTAKPVG
jgi:ribosomal subunit interface protein